MIVIGLCGRTGAGKDEFAKVLAGVPYYGRSYKHSAVLREMLVENEQPVSTERMSALFEAMAGQLGYAWLARRIVARVRNERMSSCDRSPRCITGIRNVSEVALYRNAFGADFRLVAMEANEALRFERVRNRGERPEERGMSWTAFQRVAQLGANTGEAAVMSLADMTVLNEGPREDLLTAITRILLN